MSNSIADLIKSKKQDIASKKAAHMRTLKPLDGKHTYRILPSWRIVTRADEGEKAHPFWHDFAMHYVRESESAKPTAYICVDKTFGQPCDVCSGIGQGIKASHDDATVELLKQANATQKYLLNVLHLSGPNPTDVQVIEVGQGVFDSILSFVEEYGDITDLKTGWPIIITREGTGLNTKYTVMPGFKPGAAPAALDPSIMSKLVDLDAAVSQENETRLRIALQGLAKVSGILPPAGLAAGGSRPSLVDMSDVEDLDEEEESAVVSAAGDVSDDDLDDILADLENDSTGTNG